MDEFMGKRRVGLWLIGACGGVGATTALGLAALAHGRTDTTGLLTALSPFSQLDLDAPGDFILGGHDIRQTGFLEAVREMRTLNRVFDEDLIGICAPGLTAWSENIRPGILYEPNRAIMSLADRPDVIHTSSPRAAIEQIQADLRSFQEIHRLDQVVVANVASTEPPFQPSGECNDLKQLRTALERSSKSLLPTSSLYAFAAIDAGFPYINVTPSTGASLPAIEELACLRGVPHAGQDLKTGETLVKSVLAPLFAIRNLKVLSWVGHNILGNRDGRVLNDPDNKASKVRSKDALLADILGYKPQSVVSIEFVESLSDWKTAWDHIHFEGFLGTRMTLQFTWQGCDSILAAPLLIDLARFTMLAQRRRECGALSYLACYFKNPIGATEHDLARQYDLLVRHFQLSSQLG